MLSLTQNTEFQLPTQSHYGTIVKTPAFKDPQTLETTWLIAHRGLSGNWMVREFKTEILGGENPTIDSKVYKGNNALRYGDAIKVLADYERIRKNSGMLDLVNDYPTTKNIPSYRDIAHLDGIAFDRDGYAHPTVQGNIVTDGKFETNEMMVVLEAVHNPHPSDETSLVKLSRIFSGHSQPQQVIANFEHQKLLSDIVDFIPKELRKMKALSESNMVFVHDTETVRNKRSWPGYKNGPKDFGYESIFEDMTITGYLGGTEKIKYDYDKTKENFKSLSDRVSDDLCLNSSMKENICGFFHAIYLMMQVQFIYSFISDPKKMNLSTSQEDASSLHIKRERIKRSSRYFMIEELVHYSNGKIPKDEIMDRVIAMEAMAFSPDFPKKLQEIYEAGELVIEGVKKLIPQQGSVPQIATGGTALAVPKVV